MKNTQRPARTYYNPITGEYMQIRGTRKYRKALLERDGKPGEWRRISELPWKDLYESMEVGEQE